MSRLLGRIVHWIAVVLLLIAGALLLVTTISAPVISDIAILKVELKNHSAITFGSFGHCILNVAPAASGQDYCPPKTIGYAPASIIGFIDYTTFPLQKSSAADDLTYSFVLHPIACAIAFSAALCGCVGVIGAFSGSLVALLAFLTALIVMAMDFAAFGVSLYRPLWRLYLTLFITCRSSKPMSTLNPTIAVRMPPMPLACGLASLQSYYFSLPCS